MKTKVSNCNQIVYVYRNPKDVTVSLFHFLRSINIELTYSGPWNQFVESFLIDEVYYGPWWKHLNDYEAMQPNIFFVSYEDLLTVIQHSEKNEIEFLLFFFVENRIFVKQFVV